MGARGLRAFLWFFLLMFVVRVGSAHGQAGTSFAQLNGTILDASGGSVAKASVTLREVNTNRSYNATSSDNGNYVIPDLLPGQYELKVASAGFAEYLQKSGRWKETLVGGLNSHSMMTMHRYPEMLKRYEPIKQKIIESLSGNWQLTAEQIKVVIGEK